MIPSQTYSSINCYSNSNNSFLFFISSERMIKGILERKKMWLQELNEINQFF